MDQRTILLVGILMAGLAVVFGAFGAHALKEILVSTGRTDTFELAVRYHFYHSFAILISGVLLGRFDSRKIGQAAVFFLMGILLFSGSLYVLSLTGITMLGAVTPIGGVCFIVGWALLFFGIYKTKRPI